jgi:hypothetical protein
VLTGPFCHGAAGSSGGDAGLLEALSYVNGRKAALEAELIALERSVKVLEAERGAARREVEELRGQLQVGAAGGRAGQGTHSPDALVLQTAAVGLLRLNCAACAAVLGSICG